MGRTCDEPHNILCDAEFDLQKYEKNKRKEEMAMATANNEQQISQRPSTSKQATTILTSIGGQSSKNDGFNNSQMPTTNGGIRGDNQADLRSQLEMYEPDQDTKKHKVKITQNNFNLNSFFKRALGIVVTKNEKFAILYTKDFGDCILLPRYCAE